MTKKAFQVFGGLFVVYFSFGFGGYISFLGDLSCCVVAINSCLLLVAVVVVVRFSFVRFMFVC